MMYSFPHHTTGISGLFYLLVIFFVAGCASSVTPSKNTSVSSDLIEVPISNRQNESQAAKAEQLFVRGMTRAFLGDFRSALDLYEQVADLRANEPAVLSAIAEAHEGLGELPSAVFYAEKAVELAPDNVHYRQQLASLHIRSGNTRFAADTFRSLVERFPNNTTALYELARILSSTGQYREAVRTYEQLLKVIGDNSEIYNELFRIYVQTNDTLSTEKTLCKIIELEPGNASYLRMLGDLYFQQNRVPESTEIFEQILKIDPSDFDSALFLADLYRQNGQSNKADSLLNGINQTNGASTDQLTAQASAILSTSTTQEQRSTAQHLLERALELDEKNIDARILLGQLHSQTGDFDSAAAEYFRVLQINPRDPELWVRTAAMFLEADDPKNAKEVSEEGLILFPGNVGLLSISGYAWMKSYDNDTAIDRFKEAIQISTEEMQVDTMLIAELHASMALVYWRKNDFSRSDSLYTLSISENQNDANTLNNFAFSLAERGIRLNEALHLVSRAVDLEPSNPSFLDTIGWVHYQLGQYDTALDWLSKASQNDRASAAVFEHLGDTYKKLGNDMKALENWRRSIDKNSDNPKLLEKLGQ